MFGFLKKKKFGFECPMCTRIYDVKLDPLDLPGEVSKDDPSLVTLDTFKCGFCRVEMTLTFDKRQHVVYATDEKWESRERRLTDKEDSLREEIEGVEDELKELPGNPKLRKRLDALRKRLAIAEEQYEKALDRYSDRQENWRSKYEDKMDR